VKNQYFIEGLKKIDSLCISEDQTLTKEEKKLNEFILDPNTEYKELRKKYKELSTKHLEFYFHGISKEFMEKLEDKIYNRTLSIQEAFEDLADTVCNLRSNDNFREKNLHLLDNQEIMLTDIDGEAILLNCISESEKFCKSEEFIFDALHQNPKNILFFGDDDDLYEVFTKLHKNNPQKLHDVLRCQNEDDIRYGMKSFLSSLRFMLKIKELDASYMQYAHDNDQIAIRYNSNIDFDLQQQMDRMFIHSILPPNKLEGAMKNNAELNCELIKDSPVQEIESKTLGENDHLV
jgi:hypothetical protein